MNVYDFFRENGRNSHEYSNEHVIYSLECRGNKIYVGQSRNIVNRIHDHLNNRGSMWTQKYKPHRILDLKVVTGKSDYEINLLENHLTLEYMAERKPQNVRGGQYVTYKLTKGDCQSIRSSLLHLYDLCHKCLDEKINHRNGFGKSCPKKYNDLLDYCNKCNDMPGHCTRNCPNISNIEYILETTTVNPMKLRNRSYNRTCTTKRALYY